MRISNGVATLSVQVPADLVRRANDLKKKTRINTSQMIRDGLEWRVESLETKLRREEEERNAELAKKAAARAPRRTLSGLGPPIAPVDGLPLATRARLGEHPEASDSVAKIYMEHARSIVDGPQSQIRSRAAACVAAIRREKPLTAPDEHEIISMLETYVVRLRDQREAAEGHEQKREEIAAAPSAMDKLVGAVIDVSKLKTQGKLG